MRKTKTFHKIMTALLSALFCTLLITLGCGRENTGNISAGTAYSVTDMSGTQVYFRQKPEKILTLSMCTDQIVLGLVPSSRLAGINALLDDPVSSNIVSLAKKVKMKIKDPGAEQIFSLKPDLVIIPEWGKSEMVQSLRDLGLNVVVVKAPKTIEDVRLLIGQVAAAMGEERKGKQLIGLMNKTLREIKKKTDKIPPEKKKNIVLISLMTNYGGEGCVYADACKSANVVNGISTVGVKNGQHLTKELLVKSNPDILLLPVHNDHGTFDTKKFNDRYLKDPSLQTMKAIQDHQIIYPREAFIYNCSQDVAYCVAEIARCAYGREFAFPDNAHLSISGEKNE